MNDKLPKAICGSDDNPLKIGELKLPCYVLEDGRRVLAQGGMIKALGMTYGSSNQPDRLASFVAGESNKSFYFQ